MAFMTGKGAILRLFIAGETVAALDVKSWTLKPNVTKINDGVNGEDRDRLDKELNFYDLNLVCWNETANKLAQLLKHQENDDAGVEAESVDFGLALKDKKGGKNLFGMSECTIDDWEWASSGRVERQMLTIPIRGRYVKKVAA